MVYRIFRAMAGVASGRDCRLCHEGIPPADAFGVSEGVCSGCRS